MTVAALLALLASLPSPVAIERAGCPGRVEPACAVPGRIWVAPTLHHQEFRYTLAHETGHEVDYQLLTDAQRDAFRASSHDPRSWRADGGDSPHEQWAEAFAFCTSSHEQRMAGGWKWDRGGSERLDGGAYGWEPSRRQAKADCRLVRSALSSYRPALPRSE